jgi:chemotaxis methyl-accepting protein methylase
MTALDGIMDVMFEQTRLDLRGYRRGMIERRVRARMDRLCIEDPARYLDLMRRDPAECDQLVAAVAINVSSFFRDPLVFDLIDALVLPDLLRSEDALAHRELRVWSAGCAQGEEPYSIALLLHAAIRKTRLPCTPRIFATDIDADALVRARLASYPRESLLDVHLGVLDACFLPRGGKYELRPEIKSMVDFSIDDLMRPDRLGPAAGIFSSFDLILCRNVLIYMDTPAQEQVLARLCRSLAPGGFLILGDSEGLIGESTRALRVVNERARIYRKDADIGRER